MLAWPLEKSLENLSKSSERGRKTLENRHKRYYVLRIFCIMKRKLRGLRERRNSSSRADYKSCKKFENVNFSDSSYEAKMT